MKRKAKSKAWMQEHVADPYVQRAVASGFRSRAAYKLIEIDDHDGLLRRGQTVVDLDAALDSAAKRLRKGKRDEDLAANLEALASPLAVGGGDAVTTTRRTGLAETLNGIAARLR